MPGPVEVHDGDATPDATQTTVRFVIAGVPRLVGATTGTVMDPMPLELGARMPGVEGGPAVGVSVLLGPEHTSPGATPLLTMTAHVYGTLGKPVNEPWRGDAPTAMVWVTTLGADPVAPQTADGVLVCTHFTVYELMGGKPSDVGLVNGAMMEPAVGEVMVPMVGGAGGPEKSK